MTSKQLVYEEIKQRTLENNIEENESIYRLYNIWSDFWGGI